MFLERPMEHEKTVKQTCLEYRYVVTVLIFFGTMSTQLMWTVLGVTIVSMVGHSERFHTSASNGTCPLPEDDSDQEFALESSNHTRFDWDEKTQALLLGSHSYGLIVSLMIGGHLCDQFGAKRMCGFGIFLASLMTILAPFAANYSYIALSVVRVITGLCQGTVMPSVGCIIARWIPKQDRTLIRGIIKSGGSTGAIIGSLGSGYFSGSIVLGGWRSAYYVFGCAGLVWCLFWYFLMYDNPEDHLYISTKELNYISSHMIAEGHLQKTSNGIPWKAILTSCQVWTIAVCSFGTCWSFNIMMNNLTTYLAVILHYDIETNGVLSSLHFILGVVVLILGGIVSDWIFKRRYLSDTNIRKLNVAIGNFLAPLLLIVVTLVGCNRNAIIGLLTVGGSLVVLPFAGLEITAVNMSPRNAGTILGMSSGFGEISGIVSSQVIGILTQHNETICQWKKVFYISAAVIFGTSLPFLICGSAELQEWGVNEKDDSAPNRVQIAIKNGVVCTTKLTKPPMASSQGS